MIKPISPDEVSALKQKMLPGGVISAINMVITKHFDGRSAKFGQNEIIAEISMAMGTDRQTIFSQKWLDFEPIYEAEGWKVYYDKPGYNESYEPTFTLTRKT